VSEGGEKGIAGGGTSYLEGILSGEEGKEEAEITASIFFSLNLFQVLNSLPLSTFPKLSQPSTIVLPPGQGAQGGNHHTFPLTLKEIPISLLSKTPFPAFSVNKACSALEFDLYLSQFWYEIFIYSNKHQCHTRLLEFLVGKNSTKRRLSQNFHF